MESTRYILFNDKYDGMVGRPRMNKEQVERTAQIKNDSAYLPDGWKVIEVNGEPEMRVIEIL